MQFDPDDPIPPGVTSILIGLCSLTLAGILMLGLFCSSPLEIPGQGWDPKHRAEMKDE